LLLGATLENRYRVEWLLTEDYKFIAAFAAAALFPLGFLFAALTDFTLRALEGDDPYEAKLENETWKTIWRVLELDMLSDEEKAKKINKQNAAQTFDHEFLPKETHAGAERMWTAFNIAARSCTGVILSVPLGHFCLNIQWSCWWILSAVFVAIVLYVSAQVTYERHMAFLDLQAQRDWKKINAKKQHESLKGPALKSEAARNEP